MSFTIIALDKKTKENFAKPEEMQNSHKEIFKICGGEACPKDKAMQLHIKTGI